MSLALIGSAEARKHRDKDTGRAGALSIARLEGSRPAEMLWVLMAFLVLSLWVEEIADREESSGMEL
jgi:hypothetical protein